MLKRFLGAGLGWTFGGPIGGILGWWLSGKIGTNREKSYFNRNRSRDSTSSDFMLATLILASAVIKADNKVLKSEIEFVKTFLLKHFSSPSVQEMMFFLKDIQEKTYSLEEVCQQINQNMNQEEKAHIIHFLFSISKADGEIHKSEVNIINKIAFYLKINAALLNSIKAMYLKDGDKVNNAYDILGVKKTDDIEVIRKTFRELSLKYHPDRVTHLGEEIRKNAEEKFKQISDAYETIRKDKKF